MDRPFGPPFGVCGELPENQPLLPRRSQPSCGTKRHGESALFRRGRSSLEKEIDIHAAEVSGTPAYPVAREDTWHAGLSVLFVLVNIYEGTVKDIAVHQEASPGCGGVRHFDFSVLVFWNALVSILISVTLAARSKILPDLVHRDVLWTLLKYLPVSAAFACASYLQFSILLEIPVDVFKVVEQSRLPTVALLSAFFLGERLSGTSWSALGAVTASIALYCCVRSSEAADQAELQVGQRPHHHWTINDLVYSVEEPGYKFAAGFFLSAVYVVLMCFGSVYAERILKRDGEVPFYVQKLFLELPIFAFYGLRGLLRACQGPAANGFGSVTSLCAREGSWVLACLALILLKSWASGYIVKHFSSLAKQMLSVLAVPLVYVAVLVHHCPHGSVGFCPSSIGSLSLAVAMANLAVILAVLTYSLVRVAETGQGYELKAT